MKKSKGEAKFFCENCGSEVPGKAKICPVCGKFFASVRCPKCGRTGASEEFKNGCPNCGYAVNIENGIADSNNDLSKLKNNDRKYEKTDNIGKKTQSYDSSLPVWVYIVTLIILIILIICFWSCL